jgi:hypothetical protein
MRHAAIALSFSLAAAALAAPARAADVEYHLTGKPGVVTLVNLHPDEKAKRLYSVNYQLDGLMPACTKVKILSVTNKRMEFQVDGGAKYEYVFHDTMKDPVPKHLDKYFGTACPRKKIDALAGVNKQGFKEGRILTGMSKDAVILAAGYPPEHATPSLNSTTWKYWRNRFATTNVHFQGGKVAKTN